MHMRMTLLAAAFALLVAGTAVGTLAVQDSAGPVVEVYKSPT